MFVPFRCTWFTRFYLLIDAAAIADLSSVHLYYSLWFDRVQQLLCLNSTFFGGDGKSLLQKQIQSHSLFFVILMSSLLK